MRDPEEIDLDGPIGSATVETIDDRSGLLDLSDDSGMWESPDRGVTWYILVAAALAVVATAAVFG